MADSNYDVIVIGAGITGLTATTAAAKSGLRTLNIEASMFGGLVLNINDLDGETKGSGADLASGLMTEVSDLGVEHLPATVGAIGREGDRLQVTTDAGAYGARTVIIASGARLKRLGISGEADFEYKGVSQCADCDGPLYKGLDVVVGGGDSALQEALVLAEFAKTVHLVHRRDKFSAQQRLVDTLGQHDNIRLVWNSAAEAILGGKMVESVRVRNVADNTVTEIACAGFFAYIGLQPSVDFVPAELARDANGGIVTDANLGTSIPGVFAAGAVRAGYGGLLAHAMAEGNQAARSVRAAIDR